jgi:hypothetical protein
MPPQPAPGAAGRKAPNPYRNPFRGSRAVPSRIDQGVDYYAPAGDPIYAIGPGRVDQVYSSGSGWPGGGWVSYILTAGPARGQRVFVAEDVAPAVRVGQRVDASTIVAHFSGGGSIETGWAGPLSRGDQTLAAFRNEWDTAGGDPGRYSTVAGVTFSNLIASLGGPAGHLTPGGIRGPNQQIVNVPVTQTSPGQPPADIGGSGSAGPGGGTNCVIGWQGVSVPLLGSVGQFCLISKSQARAIVGGVFVAGAALAALPILAIMIVTIAGKTKAGQAAGRVGGSVLELGGGAAAAAGAPEIGAPLAAAGSAVKRGNAPAAAGRYARRARSTARTSRADTEKLNDAQERHTAAQYRRQPRARANLERDSERERELEPVPF